MPPGWEQSVAPVSEGPTADRSLAMKAAQRSASKTLGSREGCERRGTKSQAAKQHVASKALQQNLNTTRALEQRSESETTTVCTLDT